MKDLIRRLLRENLENDIIWYHGTKIDFNVFDITKFGKTDSGWWGYGIYFHTDKDRGGYGDIVKAVKLHFKQVALLPKTNSNVFLYNILKQKIALPIEMMSESSMNIIRYIGKPEFTDIMNSLGYDGMIIQYSEGSKEAVVFNPSIIEIINQNINKETSLSEQILKSPFKGKNILYHSTKGTFFDQILNSNQIKASTTQKIKTKLNNNNINNNGYQQYNGVSLSRDNNFTFGDFQLILDGDLMKRDYGNKLIPFDFYHERGSKSSNRHGKNESEEFLVGHLNNVKKYLLGIRYRRDIFDVEYLEHLKNRVGNIPLYDKDFNTL